MTDPATGTAAPATPATPAAPVVDACALLYDNASWRAYLRRFTHGAAEYLDVFSKSFARFFGADHGAYRAALADGWEAAVDVLLPRDRPEPDLAAYLADRAAQGVVAEIAMGSPERLPDGDTVNDRVLDLTSRFRDRVRVWAGIALGDTGAALAELDRAVRAGATGLCVIPFLDGTDAADPAHTPVFGAAAEADLPVWLHTGHHFAAGRPTGIGSWRTLEALAARHPRLTLVAGHAGWPDVMETLLTAARHPRVYLEFSSHRARNMASPGSGWEPLLHHARTLARHRVLFGTSTWVNPLPVGVLAAEVEALGLGEEITADWLSGNALRMLDGPRRHRRPAA